MCEPRLELHGDPEAMRAFAERLPDLGARDAIVAPDPVPCQGGMQTCGTFAAADAVSSMALAAFITEAEETITTLKTVAASSAEEYRATDDAGAAWFAGVFVTEAAEH